LPRIGKKPYSATKLANAMSELDRDTVVSLVASRLKEEDEPLKIIEELRIGLEMAGKKYEDGEYFLTDLMLSAEIFRAAAALVLPEVKKRMGGVPTKGKLLIGTVKGDIHDVGKNIVVALSECAGFEVTDLGVDVPPSAFVRAVKKHRPQIVGMSGLLTASIESMRETIEELGKTNLRKQIKIIVGGGVVSGTVSQGKTRADAQATSAVEGIQIMEKLLREKQESHKLNL
jgi:methylmalonyl-CoA mutase cobalamin-binding domain/chain